MKKSSKMDNEKVLVNKTTRIPKEFETDKEGKVVLNEDGLTKAKSYWSYSDLIQLIMNSKLKDPVTLVEMRADLKILDELESGSKEMKFNELQVKRIKEKLETFKWGFAHIEIVEFGDAIEKL